MWIERIYASLSRMLLLLFYSHLRIFSEHSYIRVCTSCSVWILRRACGLPWSLGFFFSFSKTVLLCLEYQDNIYGGYFCLKDQQISGIKCRFPYPVLCKSNVILAVSTLTANAKNHCLWHQSQCQQKDRRNMVRQVGTLPSQVHQKWSSE